MLSHGTQLWPELLAYAALACSQQSSTGAELSAAAAREGMAVSATPTHGPHQGLQPLRARWAAQDPVHDRRRHRSLEGAQARLDRHWHVPHPAGLSLSGALLEQSCQLPWPRECAGGQASNAGRLRGGGSSPCMCHGRLHSLQRRWLRSVRRPCDAGQAARAGDTLAKDSCAWSGPTAACPPGQCAAEGSPEAVCSHTAKLDAGAGRTGRTATRCAGTRLPTQQPARARPGGPCRGLGCGAAGPRWPRRASGSAAPGMPPGHRLRQDGLQAVMSFLACNEQGA